MYPRGTYVPAESQAVRLIRTGRLCLMLPAAVFPWNLIVTGKRSVCSPAEPNAGGLVGSSLALRALSPLSLPALPGRCPRSRQGARPLGRRRRALLRRPGWRRVRALDATVQGLSPLICSPKLFII